MLLDLAILLAYATASITGGYVCGLLRWGFDARLGVAITGPGGLLIALSFLASKSGERRAEITSARHAAELREIQAASDEVVRALAVGRRAG